MATPSAAGTQRRIQALMARAWSPDAIEHASKVPAASIRRALADQQSVAPELAGDVARAYDALWAKEPPPRYREGAGSRRCAPGTCTALRLGAAAGVGRRRDRPGRRPAGGRVAAQRTAHDPGRRAGRGRRVGQGARRLPAGAQLRGGDAARRIPGPPGARLPPPAGPRRRPGSGLAAGARPGATESRDRRAATWDGSRERETSCSRQQPVGVRWRPGRELRAAGLVGATKPSAMAARHSRPAGRGLGARRGSVDRETGEQRHGMDIEDHRPGRTRGRSATGT
jgi:hypothetical protein